MHKIDFTLIKRTKFVRFDFELIVIRCSRLLGNILVHLLKDELSIACVSGEESTF